MMTSAPTLRKSKWMSLTTSGLLCKTLALHTAWTTLLKREVSLNILQLHRLYNRVMGVLGGNSELLNEGTVVPTSSCSLFQVRVVSVR